MTLVLWCLLVGSILFPRVQLGPLTIALEDGIALAGLLLIAAWLVGGRYQGAWRVRGLTALWFAIIVCGIGFGLIHSLMLLDRIVLPTEMWQYVKRMVYFLLAVRLFHSGRLDARAGIAVLLVVLLALNLIGLLQLGGPWAEPLSALYSQNDIQLEALLENDADTARNYSVTGFSTSWGGLAAFIFAISLALFLFRSKGRGSQLGIVGSMPVVAALIAMSLLNVFLSGSRAAILAAFVVLAVFGGLSLIGRENVVRKVSYIAVMLVGSLLAAYVTVTFFADRLEFLRYRNEALVTAYYEGSNRFGDVQTAMSALTDPYFWTFGVSNAVQRAEYVEYGVEVEPVYLLVNYGLFGLALRYLLLWLVVVRSFQLFRLGTAGEPLARALGAAGVAAVAGYGAFSVGYFFFQESVVGTFPWLFFGMLIGLPLRQETPMLAPGAIVAWHASTARAPATQLQESR
jgi:hypothetical protein